MASMLFGRIDRYTTFVMSIVIVSASLTQHVHAQYTALRGSRNESQLRALGPETKLGSFPIFSHLGPAANFTTTGTTTRVATVPGVPSAAELFFTLTAPVLPPGGSEVKTFISWNWILIGAPPPTCTIMVDNLGGGGFVPVVGDLIGSGSPDLCWIKEVGVSYLADVSGLGVVSLGAPNNISGASDKLMGTDPEAYGDGLTILVVFEIFGKPFRSVDVYAGYTSTESGIDGKATASIVFSRNYFGGGLHFFMNALDGQLDGGPDGPHFGDTFTINGNDAHMITGGISSDAWMGLLFAAPPAAGPPPTANWLYDHADGDISSLVTSPAAGLMAETTRPIPGDCVGHSLAAVSFATPKIPTTSPVGLIFLALLVLVGGSIVISNRIR